MGGENRASPRYALEAAVEIQAGAAVANGRTTNLSEGGFCANVDREIVPGVISSVRITLVFPGDRFSEPLSLPARVVWATELGPGRYQLGAQFHRLNAQQKHYLSMFLRYLADDSDGDQGDQGADPFAS